MNLVEYFNNEEINKINSLRVLTNFRVGDTIEVKTKIDNNTQRLQSYTGVVIAKRNRSINSSFIVRKVSHGEGVNKKFMTYSPNIVEVKILKEGIVRRAKLFYLEKLTGKAARIKERIYNKKTR
ncbi:50S ribosomal protein L19 [Rickettsia endosymbiont of Cardiosporidium cionae]|uniref:50S ribosomal protein L19 n=1 Tax=Rickettsia endosymbiont of Cardiosporidium cionae TaxID=2777155 RepID=UPI001895D591|nr:50S ribosomal protein L19 [Rickettsia endosymbiont of Cardiosporidium cionae]KAF8818842.1 50S ribosomal protein L19 [Rickettsia endosymbiont of Cardiosporidium cionae]